MPVSKAEGVVLAMGTFDGVHRGHRALLARAVSRSASLGIPCAVMAFRRPPRHFFTLPSTPSLLTTPDEKLTLLSAAGAKRIHLLSFGERLSIITAEDFFRSHILQRWHTREVVVGYNFRFGHNRSGSTDILDRLGNKAGVAVHVISPVSVDDAPVSSGRIRTLLTHGHLDEANALLGSAYMARGRVVTGRQLGRKMGFPTANVSVGKDKILPNGVFAVKVSLPDHSTRLGMANIGTRPTVTKGGRARRSFEVHLFHFNGDLVGKDLDVYLVGKIRDEIKFPSLAALQQNLTVDAERALRLLTSPRFLS